MTVDARAADRLRSAFEGNFERGLEVGAAVSVWQHGSEVVSVCGGWRDAARSVPWTQDTLVLIWSATKGLASACVLHALEKAGLDLSARVMDFWPEFGKNGKSGLTVGEILSHRAGLAALRDRTVPFLDHDAVARALGEQSPLWEPGQGHGYGPRTFGFMADEIVRRLTGRPLGRYWREEFGEPLQLDVWIGLPASEHERVAGVLAARSTLPPTDPFARAMADPGSLTRAAFSTPMGALSPSAMNTAAMRSGSFPSLGGIGSARDLAKFYAMLASGGEWEGRQYFSPEALQWMTAPLTQGMDRTLCTQTAFSGGFMLDPVDLKMEGRPPCRPQDATDDTEVVPPLKKRRHLFGPSFSAFGHPGAGGSLAFADPQNRIGFAYVMNQMEPGVLPGPRAAALVEAVYSFS